MIKVGDRVYPIFAMDMAGVVVEIKEAETTTWMVGGAMSAELVAVVKHDRDGVLQEYRYSEVMQES